MLHEMVRTSSGTCTRVMCAGHFKSNSKNQKPKTRTEVTLTNYCSILWCRLALHPLAFADITSNRTEWAFHFVVYLIRRSHFLCLILCALRFLNDDKTESCFSNCFFPLPCCRAIVLNKCAHACNDILVCVSIVSQETKCDCTCVRLKWLQTNEHHLNWKRFSSMEFKCCVVFKWYELALCEMKLSSDAVVQLLISSVKLIHFWFYNE